MSVATIIRCREVAPTPLLAGLLALALLTGGCDGAGETERREDATSLRHEGVSYRAVGPASLSITRGKLQVAGQEPGSGVEIETGGRPKGDFHFQLAPIPEGKVFSMSLVGEGGEPLARVLHRQTAGRAHPLSVDLRGLGAERFAVELRNEGEVLYREENVPLMRDTTTLVGPSSRDPDSFHYEIKEIDGEKVTVVEVDYDAEGNGPNRMPSGALVTPRVAGADARSYRVTHVAFVPEASDSFVSTAVQQIESVRLVGAQSISFQEAPSGEKELRSE